MTSSSESMEIEANEHAVRLALLGEGDLDYGLVARIAQFMRHNGSMRENEVKTAYRLLKWERDGQAR